MNIIFKAIFVAAFTFAATSLSAKESLSFYGTTDKDPLSYSCGEEITFTVKLVDKSAKNAPVLGRRIFWDLVGDDGSRRSGYAFSDKPLVVKTKMDEPGFVHLVVRAVDEDGVSIPGSGTFDSSAAADAERIPTAPAPADFNAFWDLELDRLKSVPMKASLVPVEVKNTNVVINAFSVNLLPSIGPATGLVAWPRSAADKTLPIRVILPGLGYGRVPIDERSVLRNGGEIVVVITRYGEDPLGSNAYHENMWTNVMQGYGWRNTKSKTANDQYLMVMRDVRAVSFVKTLPQWDGRNLSVGGGSMGGYRSIALAALDGDVSKCSPDYPWMCDIAGRPVYGRIGGMLPPYTDELAYLDGVNLAMRITCPVNFVFGLADYICPPSGIMVLYRNIRGPVSVKYSHNVGHGCGYGVNWPSWTRKRASRTDESEGVNVWGSRLSHKKLASTGRFRVERCGNTWWIVDPDGRLFRDLSSAVASDCAAPARQTPFVSIVKAESRAIGNAPRSMRDPFDSVFEECVTWEFAGRRALPHNPWCLGLLVDADVDFGEKHGDLARRTLCEGYGQPAKRALVKKLKSSGVLYDSARGPEQLSEEKLCELTDYLLSEYFSRTAHAVKKVGGDVMYLGCRFTSRPPQWVIAQAKGKVDIFCGDDVSRWGTLPDGVAAHDVELLRWASAK